MDAAEALATIQALEEREAYEYARQKAAMDTLLADGHALVQAGERIAELEAQVGRLHLALRLLLAEHGGLDEYVDVISNDAAELRALGREAVAQRLGRLEQALWDARGDLAGVPDGAQE